MLGRDPGCGKVPQGVKPWSFTREVLEIIPLTVSRKNLYAYVSVIFVLEAHAFAFERILVPHEHLLRLT